MFLQQFPDLKWLKNSINNRFEARKDWQGNSLKHEGWPSVILNVKTQNIYRDKIVGPVSLFGNLSGSSAVTVEGRRLEIPEGYFFVSNDKQEYTLEVEKKGAETFNVHFGNHFVSQVLQSVVQPGFESDNKNHQKNFRNRLVRINNPTRVTIKSILKDHSSMNEEEKLFDLLNFLLIHEKELTKQVQQVPVMKKSTRDEILKRLLFAVDLIYSASNQKLSLVQLSQEACLSKFHFLRLFKAAFQKTPYQFINEVRVEKAKDLLSSSELSVWEIARNTGFDSSSTFSRTFYNTTGVYPTQFQQG